MPGGFFQFMAAADGGQGVFGYKAYPSSAGTGGAKMPVALGEWLAEGARVNAAGGKRWQRREIDEAAVLRSDLIVVDDLEQAKIECGDLMWLEARGNFRWGMAHELSDVVAGRVPGRVSQEGVTLFESVGVAWRTSPPPSWFIARRKSRASGWSCYSKVCLQTRKIPSPLRERVRARVKSWHQATAPTPKYSADRVCKHV
jgi:hypothetical protein